MLIFMRADFRIDEICRSKGITLKQLAESINIHPVSFTRTLSNKGNPTYETLSKIASCLEVNVSDLFQSNKPSIELNKWEHYNYQDVITFRKLHGKYGAFSNMFTEYEIELFGIQFVASEILYMIAGFTDISIQKELLKVKNPTTAKRKFRNGDYGRIHWCKGWNQFNIDWMKFCIMQKYNQNPEFVNSLNSTKGKMILEDSTMQTGTTSFYWGAKDISKKRMINEKRKYLKENTSLSSKQIDKQIEEIYPDVVGDGYYQGVNTMGKLLTLLRDNNGILHYTLPDDIYIQGNHIKEAVSKVPSLRA
jgi:predicted NAD-dependent protein-ADP-ribosyltransferase YbiA (DUF1768 family)/DNA-binding Xre family transcriptional regulator